jgi:hypothetical protein
MRMLYAVCGWLIVALGLVHMATATRIYHSLTPAAVWFFSGGITLTLTGALNLLNRAYGPQASGLRWTCFAADVVVLAFAIVGGIVTRGSLASLVIVLGMIGGATALSLSPRAHA